MVPIRGTPELGQLIDGGLRFRRDVIFVAGIDRPFQLFDLVLAGLDREAGNIVVLRQRTEFGESDPLVGAWREEGVVPDRIVPHAHPFGCRWDQRVARRERALVGLEDVLELRDVGAWLAPAAPSVGG